MVGQAANSSVIANNYVDETFYETTPGQIGDYWVDMGVNGSHYAGTHHWLFEGNWATNCDNDETHGNALYHTYFRNWCTGYRSPFTEDIVLHSQTLRSVELLMIFLVLAGSIAEEL